MSFALGVRFFPCLFIYFYIQHRTLSTRDRLFSTCTFNGGLVPRSANLSGSQSYTFEIVNQMQHVRVETAHAVGMNC